MAKGRAIDSCLQLGPEEQELWVSWIFFIQVCRLASFKTTRSRMAMQLLFLVKHLPVCHLADCKFYQVLHRFLVNLTLVYLVRAGFGVISASHHLLCFESTFLPCSAFLITSFSGLMGKSSWKAKSTLDGPWSSLLPYSTYLCIACFSVVVMALVWFKKTIWWNGET